MRESVRHHLLLVLICCAMYFPNLGAAHLWDDDEPFFGQAAWEMYHRGDLIVPYFNRDVFVHKPPVMYWVMIAGMAVFGETEFALRVGAALFGIADVLLTYHIGRRLFSARAGFWSALILGSSLNFAVVARAAVSDPELILFCTLPILIFIVGSRVGQAERRSTDVMPWKFWALAYASMAIAVLTKGPIGIVLPTAVIGLFLLLHRTCRQGSETLAPHPRPLSPCGGEGRAMAAPSPPAPLPRWGEGSNLIFTAIRSVTSTCRWSWQTFSPLTILRTAWQMRPLTALAMLALIAGPWFVAVGLLTDGVFLEGFFGVHNFGRAMSAMEGHRGGPWYYFMAICIGTFPWCIFLAQSLLLLTRRVREVGPQREAYLLLIAWFTVWVGTFTIVSTKLPHYVLPAYPAVALMLGRFVSSWLENSFEVSRRWLRAAWGTLGFVGGALLIALPIVAQVFVPGETSLDLIGLIPLIGGGVAFWASETDRRRLAAGVLAGVAASFIVAVFGYAAARVDRFQNSHVIAGWLHELSPHSEPAVAAFEYWRPSVVYYSKLRVQDMNADEIADLFADHPGEAFVVTTDESLQRLNGRLPDDVRVLRRTKRFLEPEQIVLLGRVPKDISHQAARMDGVTRR
jgi:4-amino-4-deoxy-L-arabinose transferase-like glycosyltransferase